MLKLNITEAIGLTLKTYPFVLVRGLLYLLFGVFVAAYFGLALWLGYLFKGGAASLIFIIATVGMFPIIKLFKYFVLYLLKAGHVAVMSKIISEGNLPEGVNQVEFGKDFVISKFKTTAALWGLDALVGAILKSFTRTAVNMAQFTGLDALQGLVKLFNLLINYSVTLVDEAILSFIVIRNEDNFWEGAKDGIILYVQSWKNILLNSAVMGVINAISFVVFFIFLAAPVALLFPNHGMAGAIVAAVFAYILKEAFVYPVAIASILITFHQETKDQSPDAAWEARLDAVSTKFTELKQKAIDFSKGAKTVPSTGS